MNDELIRAEEIANRLSSCIALSKKLQLVRVSMTLEDAEELTQMLFDSLRIAKELQPKVQHNGYRQHHSSHRR